MPPGAEGEVEGYEEPEGLAPAEEGMVVPPLQSIGQNLERGQILEGEDKPSSPGTGTVMTPKPNASNSDRNLKF